MGMIISCDVESLYVLGVRLRRVAAQVRSRDASLRAISAGNAFKGATAETAHSFEELREQTRRAGLVLASELEALAGAIEAGSRAFTRAEQSLVASLNGFVTTS